MALGIDNSDVRRIGGHCFWKRRRSMEKVGEALGSCRHWTKPCLAEDHHISRQMQVGRTRWHDREVGSEREKVLWSNRREKSDAQVIQ